MAKVRTTIALSEASHHWLRARTTSTGEMAEYLDSLIQRERTLGPIEDRLQRYTYQLGNLIDEKAGSRG
jgi:hypothetical protein